MDLSVIIVNYNVRQFLENALTSVLRALEGLQGEIFVVDNASDDGSVEMVKAKFPRVVLIENKSNVGFAKANNAALKRARGKYLLLLNPDTVVQEDTFHVMTRFFEDNPDVGLAGCKILNADGSFQLACRRSFPTPWVAFTRIAGLGALFPRSKFFGRYNLTHLSADETYEVDAVSGSFMMTRRDVYEQVGGLDETFFMYGEDLDWCYRIRLAGFKIYYVHATKIIHYRGESTKRSDIDEIKVFYHAMQIFVEKHFSKWFAVEFLLTTAILLRAGVAFLGRASRTLSTGAVDFGLVTGSLILAEILYFGKMFKFPSYAYPIVWTVPSSVVVLSLFFLGVYTSYRHSASRAAVAVIISYTLISASVFFAKEFAFSRAVVLISGLLMFVVLPGWRLLFLSFGRSGVRHGRRKSLFGRRTVIVGTGASAQEVFRKLRARVDDGYDVVGFIDTHRKRIGEQVAGLEIIGSIDNVGKVISEKRVGEVIFSTEGLTYMDILSVIARSNDRNVNFRLVPNSLEVIIGKTRIDELDPLPLVEINYNIHKSMNRFVKRLFDLALSFLVFFPLYPAARLGRRRWHSGRVRRIVDLTLLLPRVLAGELSLVGRPIDNVGDAQGSESYLGPCGLTGLVQINRRSDLTPEEIERYKLYYAKNQSLGLDVEIILKSVLIFLRKE